jgi:hypothetical protein
VLLILSKELAKAYLRGKTKESYRAIIRAIKKCAVY